MDFNFTVRGDKISADKEYRFIEGNKGYYRAVFDFGDDPVWDDGAKICIVESGGNVYKTVIAGNWCFLPEMVRGSMRIGAFCVESLDGADLTTRISTNMLTIGVQDGAAGAEVNAEFTTAAEVWEQYLADMEKSRAAAEEASEKAAQSEANAKVSADDALLSKEFARGYAEGAQKCEKEACDSAKEAETSCAEARKQAEEAYLARENAERYAGLAESSAESIKNLSVNATEGEEASVVKVDTEDGVMLEFTLPKGEKGDKGDTGARGEQGPKGDSYILTDKDKESMLNTPRQTLYLENNLRIEAREDGIYLCGIVDEEYGIEDETLLYSPGGGVQAAEAGHANIADEAYTAVDANYSYCAEVDAEERTLKGTTVNERGDLENAECYIADGTVASFGIISISLIASLEEGYQYVGFESALYFTTPSAIPENYTQFPADIYFKGDSTDEGAFVPEANTRYTIVFDFDGYMLNGYVSGVTTV